MALSRSIAFSYFLVAGLAVSATQAQVHRVASTADDDAEEFGAWATDAALGVNAEAVVTTSNQRMTIFDRSGTLLDVRTVSDLDPLSATFWPFFRIDTTDDPGAMELKSRMFDAQAEYHPQTGRLWVVYGEQNASDGFGFTFGSGDNNISPLHLAVSKEMTGTNELDSFDNEDWWYYTGLNDTDPNTPIGNGDGYFDLQDTGMTRYPDSRSGVSNPHAPYPTGGTFFDGSLVDKPHMAIDEQAAYITSYGEIGSTMVIIPLSHGSGDSILDGDKPAAIDLTFMRFVDLPAEDKHTRHFAVQEPYEDGDFENAQFFISNNDNEIRVGAMWHDGSRWNYSQRVETTTSTVPEDIILTGSDVFASGQGVEADTPDTVHGFGPRTGGSFFPSAVLARDANGDPRIFAVHAVQPIVSGTPTGQLVIQWYVIDPDLGDVQTAPLSTAFEPDIVEVGRLDTPGDRYHPTIGVTQQGVAYIEFTYSSTTVWPEVRRVTLNSSYTDIVPNSEVTVQPGVSYPYVGALPGWADFSDMQADPVTSCAFWSVHTLVHDVDDGPTVLDRRDVWLFQTLFNCGNSNLNFDAGTDLYDMAMFNSLYGAGARRVDMNTDGQTDATDAILYQDAYDAATSP
ncbi:MAG: hypothetical protein ACIAS6_02190 [Phycisphaerales bacterium JB060]